MYNKVKAEAECKMSKNSLTAILEANKFNETNYNDWMQNLRIVLDFENQTYVLDRSLPRTLLEGSTCEERLTFETERFVVYAVSNRHIIYTVTKAFLGAKMIEESSVQKHRVKMLSLMEKLKDLKIDLEKETYIYVILQSLPPFFNPFILNCNMNGLDKDLHELINTLVAYEVAVQKSAPSVLVVGVAYESSRLANFASRVDFELD
ncbi:uncharacterized protein LOC105173324 [Sesamum indicum]|uniref:Uncharacterized protein LOC105173324 n=1 Tax=Sesamum indicum TaxID=4182 RepID=A0A6I9U7M6_SESIN|nr:uncharacterized protein LOC105173324 [Sesamum indicum]